MQHTWRQSIENDDSYVNGAVTMHVEHSHQSHHKYSSSNGQKLGTNTYKQHIHRQ